MARQLSLFKDPRRNTKRWWIVKQSTYGGSLNYRKVARPFDSKKLVHAVLKSQLGRAFWFSRYPQKHRELIVRAARRYHVTLTDLAINHDHIHLLYSAKSKDLNASFLRFLSAEFGRRYSRLRRSVGLTGRPLWTQRPFTRLVSWSRKSVTAARNYIKRNRHEALGFIPYQPRAHRLTAFLKSWEKQSFNSA